MKHRILMVVNPKAGRAKIKKYVNDIRNNLERSQYKIDLKRTTAYKITVQGYQWKL